MYLWNVALIVCSPIGPWRRASHLSIYMNVCASRPHAICFVSLDLYLSLGNHTCADRILEKQNPLQSSNPKHQLHDCLCTGHLWRQERHWVLQ